MRILFGALHFSYFRNYESVLCRLAERGHDVVVTADIHDSTGGQSIVERLAAAYPDRIRFAFAPSLDGWPFIRLAKKLRRSLEWVRFADPYYDPVPKYRTRTRVWTPRVVLSLFRVRWVSTAPVRRLLAALLGWLERGVPTYEALDAFIEDIAPDVVVLASVTNSESMQLDHLKSAMAAGRHASISVWSWDHLSGKAWLRIVPEQMLVWNETQKEEAVGMHGIDPSRVVITGAQCYDQWFNRQPSAGRAAFCQEIGLDAGRPYLLWVCSVLSRPAPQEAPFVRAWIRRIRASNDPKLRDVGILVRPHPERRREWDTVSLDEFENAAIRGAHPINAHARAEYFDSMYHSAAVVGLVTSAFVEAGVVGRPVFTIQEDTFREHQGQSPHFHLLTRTGGGLLHSAESLDAHVAQVSAALADPGPPAEKSRRFVEAFVRPFGLDVPATDVFVSALERLSAAASPARERFGRGPSRLAVGVLQRLVGTRWGASMVSCEEERRVERLIADRVIEEREIKARLQAEKAAKREAFARRDAARLVEEQEIKARKHAERDARKLIRRRATDAARKARA